jgi:Protein of unknown function (DUF2827)
MDNLPGMSECAKSPSDNCRPVSTPWKPLVDRKIILIATATIQNQSFFVNGLFQNIFMFYKLFESLGYAPIFLVNDKPKDINAVPIILRHARMITVDEISRSPIPIHLYIEIGMSIDPSIRKAFRMSGTKVVKLYLGNILNIDIETPMFYSGMNFAHHIVGEMDEIWVSPHYKQHDEYAAILNHVEPSPESMKIAPYIWDPCVLTLNETRNFKWRPRQKDEQETFIILEPNISFQKSSLLPILIAERYYRETKRDIFVLVGNSEKLLSNPFFTKTIMPALELVKDNKILFGNRYDISTILSDHPHATAICHQWNNQYNYMTLEYLVSGFPVVHNAPDWSDAGYFYDGNNVDLGLEALKRAQTQHVFNGEQMKASTEALRWRHSIYNPEIQKAWKVLLP